MSQAWTIFGTGAHARKAAQCAQRAGNRLWAFVDENPASTSPLASVAPDPLLGEGVLVPAGAVAEGGARIGRGAIVDIGVLVDHDAVVAEFCHLRPGQVCPAGSAWPA